MITRIIVILPVIWQRGYFGPNVFSGFPRSGNFVHSLSLLSSFS